MIKCKLSKILGEKRLTMTWLSEKTGLSKPTLRKFYHDKAKFHTLDEICKALDIEVGELLEYKKGE